MQTVMRFLFPKVCLYCKEVHAGGGLLCEGCLVGLDFLGIRGRCKRCFREGCRECFKKPRAWYRAGGLFWEGGSGSALLHEPDRFSKEIAAFFVIQYVRLGWELPDAFYVDPLFQPIIADLKKFLPIKPISKGVDYSGKKILYFVKSPTGCEAPECLLGAYIFLIAYTYPE